MEGLQKVEGNDNSERIADVIFVHGVGGHPINTWQRSNESETFWPRWLAEDMPNLEVWTLGYHADPSNWQRASMPLADQCSNILEQFYCEEIGKRPIIYVAHSMGGIVVKQLLRHADTLGVQRWKSIAKQTRAIVFIATPHSGANLANFATFVGTIFRTSDQVTELTAHNSRLRELHNWFLGYQRNASFPCRCYCETRPLAPSILGMKWPNGLIVVDPTSADAGIPQEVAIHLLEDHISIAKPSSRNAELYKSVRRFFKDIAIEISGCGNDEHWQPTAPYPLTPAARFVGRDSILAQLTTWASDTSSEVRVRAIVAAGGTGKTALAQEVYQRITRERNCKAGVFAWTFYENHQTEAFLRHACEYILGEVPKETGALFDRLQRGLVSHEPHFFIIDGLEWLQVDGDQERPRGQLKDPAMRRFLAWLATGSETKSKALITSRLPLVDLADYALNGYLEYPLEDLEVVAARQVLRRWKIKGDDETLDKLAGTIHQHALTLDVLGSYLHNFHDGDPTKAPTFDPKDLIDTDSKTAKLYRVLTDYSERLSAKERDLLARLSVFPRGVTIDWLQHVVEAGGDVAGALTRISPDELTKLLKRLGDLRLVFRYQADGIATYAAHPFLTKFFEKLLGLQGAQQVNEALRHRIVPSLESRPEQLPTAPADLDKYDLFFQTTVLAGKPQLAFEIYSATLGGYEHLGMALGEHARGFGMLNSLFISPPATNTQCVLPEKIPQGSLLNDWTRFAISNGDLAHANLFLTQIDLEKLDRLRPRDRFTAAMLVVLIHGLAGKWRVLERLSEDLAAHYQDNEGMLAAIFARSTIIAKFNLGDMAASYAGLNKVKDPTFLRRFLILDMFEADCFQLQRDFVATKIITKGIREVAESQRWNQFVAVCEFSYGRSALPNTTLARRHLDNARVYIAKAGDAIVELMGYILETAIARAEGKLNEAFRAAQKAQQLADVSGFDHWSCLARIELAKILVAAEQYESAIAPATWVLDRSRNPDCQSNWNISDSLHLLGVAHGMIGNRIDAGEFLKEALEIRKSLRHSEIQETEKVIKRFE